MKCYDFLHSSINNQIFIIIVKHKTHENDSEKKAKNIQIKTC